jgi:hypothetical protein
MKKQILLTISIEAVILTSICAIPSAFALQFTNYADPNGRWTIQYPSDWLAGHSNTIRSNDSQGVNESKFTPFDSGNVSIAVGIGSNVMNKSYAALIQRGGGQLNCDAFVIAGHKACIAIMSLAYPSSDMVVITTINGTNYLLDLHADAQAGFNRAFPIFMQMLTTFKPK